MNSWIKHRLYIVGAVLCASLVSAGATAQAELSEEGLWSALASPNHAALIRHALAPGTGDPADFELGRRDTQRNLSDAGREQAARIGALFRANGIQAAEVYSSEWFRCMDTAELLDLGPVTPFPTLNSFFRQYGKREPQTRALTRWLVEHDMDSPLVMITHQVNITALTGVYPASGEIVVVNRDEEGALGVVGRIRTD